MKDSRRKCTICGARLSERNPGPDCWSHGKPEGLGTEKPWTESCCTSHFNKGRYRAIVDYEGWYID